jgi:hypothetical protein
MYIPRLLLLSLLISLCAATAAAQSSANNNSHSSQPASRLPQNAQASTGPFQFQLPFLTDAQRLSDNDGAVQGTIQQGNDSVPMLPLDSRVHILTLPRRTRRRVSQSGRIALLARARTRTRQGLLAIPRASPRHGFS